MRGACNEHGGFLESRCAARGRRWRVLVPDETRQVRFAENQTAVLILVDDHYSEILTVFRRIFERSLAYRRYFLVRPICWFLKVSN